MGRERHTGRVSKISGIYTQYRCILSIKPNVKCEPYTQPRFIQWYMCMHVLANGVATYQSRAVPVVIWEVYILPCTYVDRVHNHAREIQFPHYSHHNSKLLVQLYTC